ncbi:hypothetical protein ASE14_11525 [Agromyces sp. Root81]|uniref:hypothetical protein n=1 Tax=Agromyces sp. Root81 TaxID=1736601 RepID=UPI0007015FD5|nr:hypothetical protein [Agromyces sp. Root81]KRC61488.1 hypothetical protein ASE14_11525 [Agromyces sp. Root81]
MGASAVIDYVIDLDDDLWIGVPPGFPYLAWEDAAGWAAEISVAAVPDDLERRGRFEEAAMGVASVHPPGVDHVLWYAPADGSTMGVAFLTVVDAAGETVDLAAVAESGIDSATPVQTASHPSARFGTVVQSAATIRLADVGDEGGAAAGVAGSIRTVAAADETVFMLNSVDEDLATLALMQPAMLELFERIELLPTRADVERAVTALGSPVD